MLDIALILSHRTRKSLLPLTIVEVSTQFIKNPFCDDILADQPGSLDYPLQLVGHMHNHHLRLGKLSTGLLSTDLCIRHTPRRTIMLAPDHKRCPEASPTARMGLLLSRVVLSSRLLRCLLSNSRRPRRVWVSIPTCCPGNRNRLLPEVCDNILQESN